MSLLFQLADVFTVASSNVAGFLDTNVVTSVVAAADPDNATKVKPSSEIVDSLVKFVLPLILLVVGFYSVKFLMQRQMTQFFQFIVVAVLVVMLIVNPGVIQKIANWFSSIF